MAVEAASIVHNTHSGLVIEHIRYSLLSCLVRHVYYIAANQDYPLASAVSV